MSRDAYLYQNRTWYLQGDGVLLAHVPDTGWTRVPLAECEGAVAIPEGWDTHQIVALAERIEKAAGKGYAISGHAPDCELVVQPNVAPRRGWMCDCRGRSAEKSDKVKP